MDPVAVLAVALAVLGLGLGVWVCLVGPSNLRNLFRYQTLGWPSGVQEDDDARWAWTRRPDPSVPAVERVHGRVRPG